MKPEEIKEHEPQKHSDAALDSERKFKNERLGKEVAESEGE